MLICIAMLLFQVAGVEPAPVSPDDVVTMIAHGDGGQAAVALATLWNNEELLLETVPKLLPLLKTCPPTFNENWLEQEAKPFPEWRIGSLGELPDRWKGKERKEIVLKWICSAIREAGISPRRDIVRKTVLEYLEANDTLGTERYYWARDLYFWWGSDIEPESNCLELLVFIDRELTKRQDISKTDRLIMPLGEYIFYKVELEKWDELISKYEGSFSSKEINFLKRRILYERGKPLPESEFRSLDNYEPQKLLKSMDNPFDPRMEKDCLIKQLLVGTRELRIKNFQLLLPILKQSEPLGRNFLYTYAIPIPVDAPEEEKHQQDIYLDLLEEKM